MIPARTLLSALALLAGLQPLSCPAQRGDAPDAPLLSPEMEQRLFHLPPGFEIQLVASEPEIPKPLNMNFDARGRLWVTGTEMYPWPAQEDARGDMIPSFDRNFEANRLAFRGTGPAPEPPRQARDSLRVLSEIDPVTGRAKRVSVFAGGLNIPMGIAPLPRRPGEAGDTVMVYSIPSIWRLRDVDGDGRADEREAVYSEFGFKDSHGMVNNWVPWIDGWIYGAHGYSNHSEVRDGSGRVTVLDSGNTYRFRPDGSRFEQWTHGQTNPFGLSFDPLGNIYTADSHSKPVYLLVPGGYYEGISKHDDGLGFAPAITHDNHGSSAIAGITYYAAAQFPEEFRGNLFNGNPVTRRINRDRLNWVGSTPRAERMPDFLTCDDPNFRPVQVKLGPDGALWIADFYNPIIAHYEVPLDHPSRDHVRGRIWRIVWHGEDNAIAPPIIPDLSALSAAELVSRLQDDNLEVRRLVSTELLERVPEVEARRALAETPFSAGASALFDAVVRERLDLWPAGGLSALLKVGSSDEIPTAVAALKTMWLRSDYTPADREALTQLVDKGGLGMVWRAMAELFARRPAAWQVPLLLKMRMAAPAEDEELVYSLRLALKVQVAHATSDQLSTWSAVDPCAPGLLADAALAVDKVEAAEYLLGYLERTQFAAPRLGEIARHALPLLPGDRLESLHRMVSAVKKASGEQRLALAEGLAEAARGREQPWPQDVQEWMGQTLLEQTESTDVTSAVRAIEATRELNIPEAEAKLIAILEDRDRTQKVREAALKQIGTSQVGRDVLVRVLQDTQERKGVRLRSAERLGQIWSENDNDAIRRPIEESFAATLVGAESDLAVTAAIRLAASDRGAQLLMTAVEQKQVPPDLLQHRYVANALAARSEAVRKQVAALTANLISEDQRLNELVAKRARHFAVAKLDPQNGRRVFQQNCTSCHRMEGEGGNIGPNLDGIGSRDPRRLIEDILDPSRNVDPTFRLTVLTLKDGGSRSGMNLREEDGAVILTDPATAVELRTPKAEVESLVQYPTSIMPPSFESILSEQDFFDLLSYLRGTAE